MATTLIDRIWKAYVKSELVQDTKQWPTEEQMQAAIFQWHWNTYPEHRRTLFHVQQKAKNAVEGSRFKAIGVVRGPSDLILLLPEGITVYCELKLPEGVQSKEQQEFQKQAVDRGHLYFIFRSFMAFKTFIENIYYY